MRRIAIIFGVVLVGAIATACGETVTSSQRVDRCLAKQPDATQADCKKWEKAKELEDNGRHRGHENM